MHGETVKRNRLTLHHQQAVTVYVAFGIYSAEDIKIM